VTQPTILRHLGSGKDLYAEVAERESPELMRQPAELLASLNEPLLNRSDAP
jgi:hypothetical protein